MRKSLTSGVAAAALALGVSVALAQAPQSSPPRSPAPGVGGERSTGPAPGQERQLERQQERGAQQQQGQGSERAQERRGETTGSTGAAATKVDVNPEQRSKLTGVVKNVQIREVSNVNVPISVGAVLPSSVELVSVPSEIISIVPTFSSYRAIRVGGRILIVEPDTRRIVYIIDA